MATDSEYRYFPRRGAGGEQSPLGVVWAAFEPIAAEPLPADAGPVPGGPVGSWGELSQRLLDPGLAFEVLNAIWRWLIEYAGARWDERGGQAVITCTGLALPMLAGTADRFAPPDSAHRADVEAEVLAGFLVQVREIDVYSPQLYLRLWSASQHAGRAWVRQHTRAPLAVDLDDDAMPGYARRAVRTPPGHPDLVLAEAVAEEVITPQAAEVIVQTRLERRAMTSVTPEIYVSRSYWQIHRHRERAEAALAVWLADRAADPDPVPAGTPTVHPEAAPHHSDPAAGPHARTQEPTTSRSRSRRNPDQHTEAATATGYQEVRRCA